MTTNETEFSVCLARAEFLVSSIPTLFPQIFFFSFSFCYFFNFVLSNFASYILFWEMLALFFCGFVPNFPMVKGSFDILPTNYAYEYVKFALHCTRCNNLGKKWRNIFSLLFQLVFL